MSRKYSHHIILACTYSLICLGSLALASCSKKAPAVGESITHTQLDEGLSLTEGESRRLQANGKIAGEESALVKAEATVYKIDYKTRILTLKTAQGDPIEMIAGPEIINFNQIQAGDKVNAEYLISVAFEVREPTAQELAAASGKAVEVNARAKLGKMPAGGEAIGKVNVSKVESIDQVSGTITLKDITTGTIAQVKAKYPENLSYVKTGDSVVITAVAALAASISRVP